MPRCSDRQFSPCCPGFLPDRSSGRRRAGGECAAADSRTRGWCRPAFASPCGQWPGRARPARPSVRGRHRWPRADHRSTGVGAAVANAVYNACGKRVRNLPITLDKLL
ncbi:hypothetical protein BTW07_02775 [Salinicola socius]|uniref:Aldehyde oxidase/xanthine dehydrogenase second molybdopterin binding domain-containing protein n=1 Tax=Salinicola socius TaxID=404433 RepID=A0A1Q8SWN8_9GAMM|nr:hypothetical protein BTW07_02775 [Salinicola socius]